MESKQSNTNPALKRFDRDIEIYHREIEEMTESIKTELDEFKKRHLEKMLLETQRALCEVLRKKQEFE